MPDLTLNRMRRYALWHDATGEQTVYRVADFDYDGEAEELLQRVFAEVFQR